MLTLITKLPSLPALLLLQNLLKAKRFGIVEGIMRICLPDMEDYYDGDTWGHANLVGKSLTVIAATGRRHSDDLHLSLSHVMAPQLGRPLLVLNPGSASEQLDLRFACMELVLTFSKKQRGLEQLAPLVGGVGSS
ncbi:hypothetical protein ACLB2K_034169 [Fragaria x ananassa]